MCPGIFVSHIPQALHLPHLSTERPGPTPSSGLVLDKRYDSLSKMDEATDKAAAFWLIFFSSVTIALATNLRIWWERWKVTVAHLKRTAQISREKEKEKPDELQMRALQ